MEKEWNVNKDNDSCIIDNEIQLAMKRTEGLTVIPAPTGSSKTYNLTKNMARFILAREKGYSKEAKHIRFIAIIPNLNNFPTEEDIAQRIYELAGYTMEKAHSLVKQHVLYMRNNLTCMAEGIKQNPDIGDTILHMNYIPGEFKDAILADIGRIQEYVNLKNPSKNEPDSYEAMLRMAGYAKDIEEKAGMAEGDMRLRFRYILRYLNKKEKEARKKDEKEARTWETRVKDMEKLVKSIFSLSCYEDFCVWILSVDKYIMRYDPVIAPYFWMTDKKILDKSIIFMDESDSAYGRMLDGIIRQVNDSAIRVKEMMVELTSNYFTRKLTGNVEEAMNNAFKKRSSPCRMENLRVAGDAFKEKYHLDYAYKTDDESMKGSVMPALLNDGRQYNVGEGKNYVRAKLNRHRKQVMLSLGPKGKKTSTPDEINMIKFFSDAQKLIRHYRTFLKSTAQAYIKIWKRNQKKQYDSSGHLINKELPLVDALQTVMNSLSMSSESKKLFTDLCLRDTGATAPAEYLDMDFSFFSCGYDVKLIKDNLQQQAENSVIEMYLAWQTPEKILLTMANNANVIWSSATALNRSVNENFAVSYIKEQLGDKYHEMSDEGQKALREFYAYKNKPYYEGSWAIEPVVLPEIETGKELSEPMNRSAKEAAKTFVHPENFNHILNGIDSHRFPPYVRDRYMNLVHALSDFIHNPMLLSMVCLEKKSLSNTDPEYSEEIVASLIGIICKDASLDTSRLTIMHATSRDFKEKLDKMKELWAEGKKGIFFSTYATTSKGSNLQYPVPKQPMIKAALVKLAPALEDMIPVKYKEKDIDCLYLGKYTYLSASVEGNADMKRAEAFHKVIFEAQKLYALNQIGYLCKKDRIRKAYMEVDNRRQVYSKDWKDFYTDKSIQNTPGIKNTINKMVKQSIGRMERTNVKNCLTKIYIAEELLKSMDRRELRDTEKDLIPGMQEIKKLADRYGTVEEDMAKEKEEDNLYVLRSVTLQHRRSCLNFKRLLNTMRFSEKDYRKLAIEKYNRLRTLVLEHPILTTEAFNALSAPDKKLVHHYYIDTHRNDVVSYGYTNENNQYMGAKDLDDLIITAKGFNGGSSDQVQEAKTILPHALQVKGISQLFEDKGYAKHWNKGQYILTPKGRDIYNGILGEVVVKFILDEIISDMKKVFPGMAKAQIEEMAPEVVEKFDFKLGPLYIDAKNWRYGVARLGAAEFKKHILDKREECNAFYGIQGAAVVINLLPLNENISNEQMVQDNDYLEIRRLLNSDYTVNETARKKLISIIRKAAETDEGKNE